MAEVVLVVIEVVVVDSVAVDDVSMDMNCRMPPPLPWPPSSAFIRRRRDDQDDDVGCRSRSTFMMPLLLPAMAPTRARINLDGTLDNCASLVMANSKTNERRRVGSAIFILTAAFMSITITPYCSSTSFDYY